ncbi:MAG: hypothetical protein ED554_12795, partial [Synechococcus sp. YX04-3]
PEKIAQCQVKHSSIRELMIEPLRPTSTPTMKPPHYEVVFLCFALLFVHQFFSESLVLTFS